MKPNIVREIELWITSFILSLGILLLLATIVMAFWCFWTSFEDKHIAVYSTMTIISTTIIVRSFLKDNTTV